MAFDGLAGLKNDLHAAQTGGQVGYSATFNGQSIPSYMLAKPTAPQGNLGGVLGASTVAQAPAAPSPQQIAAQQQAAADAKAKADTVAFLNDQFNQLGSLLGHTDTAHQNAMQKNEDAYNENVGVATTGKNQQIQGQNTAKQSTYDQINRNAGNGYRSLAQIIGRSAGSGSSAFQDLLPDVVGKDTSSKRKNATDTYGQNLSEIDNSFQSTLQNLIKQKKGNQETLDTGWQSNRQGILNQQAANRGQLAQANGGGYAQVKAAQAPLQAQIESSRNAVDGFFNQYRTPYTAPVLDPHLAEYKADRTNVNAQQQGASDPTNPYSALLKKKLQGTV